MKTTALIGFSVNEAFAHIARNYGGQRMTLSTVATVKDGLLDLGERITIAVGDNDRFVLLGPTFHFSPEDRAEFDAVTERRPQ